MVIDTGDAADLRALGVLRRVIECRVCQETFADKVEDREGK